MLKVSVDGLARLGREKEREEVVWDGERGEGTRVGDGVALVWEGLGRVRDSIRV